MTSFVMLFDCYKGDFVKEARYTLSPMEALIAAVEQFKGNFNTMDYPKTLPEVYPSKAVKGRLLYDINEQYIMYSQPA